MRPDRVEVQIQIPSCLGRMYLLRHRRAHWSRTHGTLQRSGMPLVSVTLLLLIKSQATEVDMLIGSMANGLCSTGGFCAGTLAMCDHQVRHPPLLN